MVNNVKTTDFSAVDDDNDEVMLSMRAEQRPQSTKKSSLTAKSSSKASVATRSKRLTDCPACEGIVSRRAHFCPHCGEPDPSRHMQRSQWLSRIVWTAIISAGCWYAYVELMPWVIERMK
ncbi:hypothetical protein UB33_18655 [Photobacterium angustum]|nr:hypothetical protein UB33_18655 [Photobacterium angustum]PSV87557.1 hypothetical protein CTN01_22225 [Photobacterium angustum]PSW80016.1 hypothetical protein CTN03_11985 [Photobacterium angustum]